MTGPRRCLRVSIVPAIAPANFRLLGAGLISAIGLPCRVTRSGFFVLLTSSSKDKHFALNFEMVISFTVAFLVSFYSARHLLCIRARLSVLPKAARKYRPC